MPEYVFVLSQNRGTKERPAPSMVESVPDFFVSGHHLSLVFLVYQAIVGLMRPSRALRLYKVVKGFKASRVLYGVQGNSSRLARSPDGFRMAIVGSSQPDYLLCTA